MSRSKELVKELRELRTKIAFTKDLEVKEQLKNEAEVVRKKYSMALFEEKMNERKKGR